MKHFYFYLSPVGLLRIIENEHGITAIEYVNRNPINPNNAEEKKTPIIKDTIEELSEYFAGKRKEFNIPLDIQGSEFQKQVWDALILIPYSETRTYKQIAEAIGNPKGSRAVGLANNRNPIPIIIPCHRVIGTNGSLTGYAGGLNIKDKLLKIEKR